MNPLFFVVLLFNLSWIGLLLGAADRVEARQNIVTGDVSVRYDYQERTYGSDSPVEAASGENGTVVLVFEDRRGDRRRYMIAPRLSFSSTGISDVLQFSYAPALNYDHLYETTDLDHDLSLLGEKRLNRQWSLSLQNRFFLGDDPVHESALKTVVVAPATEEVQDTAEQSQTGVAVEENSDNLTERYGRRRYWTNALDMLTQYQYGADCQIHGGYTFNVLRNDGENTGGYTEYDRHTGVLGINHRFSQQWSSLVEARVVRGLFDEPEVVVVTPTSSGDSSTGSGESVTVDQVSGTDSDDLTEYNFKMQGGYDFSPRFRTYAEYSFLSTDYDASLREDYRVNNVALGIDYNLSQHLRMTFSGGPSWGAFENSPTESDYNLRGGLTWDFFHGNLSVFADKRYDQANFNGRRSGLTDVWKIGASLGYQLTEKLSASFSSSYRNNSRLEFPQPQTIVVIPGDTSPSTEGAIPSEGINTVEYVEKNYDAGLEVRYAFLRYFGLSGGYRYYKYETDLAADSGSDYDEHRFFIQLSAGNELFRW